MSGKPASLRIKKPISINPISRLTISTHVDEDSKTITEASHSLSQRRRIPKLHPVLNMKNFPFTSRRKLSQIPSPHTPRTQNFSIDNTKIKKSTNRVRNFSVSSNTVVYPLGPIETIENFKDSLNEVELSEVFNYGEIWYTGHNAKKVKTDACLPNSGFDNDRGDYKIVINDHIAYRYQIQSLLGTGSFGQVVKCLDHKSKEQVAVKVIKNKKKFNKQGLVEAKVLKTLQENDQNDVKNVVRLLTFFTFRSHICLVFELLSMNLYELVKINHFQRLSLVLVHRFAVQILVALDYINSLNIVHCDLKPENILLKNPKKSGIKIIDFGSGCFENERIYTYIQSRFYRAPEVMLGIPYNSKIDMWSFACILGELCCGFPLFPGETENELFCRIMEVLGVPPEKMLEKSSRKKVFFDVNNKPKIAGGNRGKVRIPASRDLKEIVGTEDEGFLEFLKMILVWEPEKRLGPAEALRHKWIVQGVEKEENGKKTSGY